MRCNQIDPVGMTLSEANQTLDYLLIISRFELSIIQSNQFYCPTVRVISFADWEQPERGR